MPATASNDGQGPTPGNKQRRKEGQAARRVRQRLSRSPGEGGDTNARGDNQPSSARKPSNAATVAAALTSTSAGARKPSDAATVAATLTSTPQPQVASTLVPSAEHWQLNAPMKPALDTHVHRCADCGQIFPSRQAKVAHQMLSAAPYEAIWPNVQPPVWPGTGEQTVKASATEQSSGHAPKHGVRLLRSMLDVSLAMPCILAEPTAAIDLEGNLTPGPACTIDLLQVYLPGADVVYLIHCVSLPQQPLANLLAPWLTSSRHHKVLCDARADSDALQHLFSIRLTGVIDVQLCHAAATGDLARFTAVSKDPLGAANHGRFSFPVGLSRLTASYCTQEVAAPIAALKGQFGALFDAGAAPFRNLPLTNAAASYAAADVWHIWLIYEALWGALQQAGLAMQVILASEARAGEFRDVAGGRDRWEEAVGIARANRNDKKGAEKGTEKRASGKGVGSKGGAATSLDPAAGDGAGAAGAMEKRRQISGPGCECCAVRFSGQKQLDEHMSGKRHAVAAAAAAKPSALLLAVECRQSALTLKDLRECFSPHGTIAHLALESKNPLAGTVGAAKPPQPDGAPTRPGPWFASLRYTDPAATARALGQRFLYVNKKRVYLEPVDM